MSRSTNCTFTCPCGKVFTSPIYEYVNIAQDPQLQYTVLAGLLNVSTCPACGRRTALSRPFMYSDSAHNLLVYVHPRAHPPEGAQRLLLEKLRSAYTDIEIADIEVGQETQCERDSRNCPSLTAKLSQEMPPLRVVFGIDQLNELINATLGQQERLGRLVLRTQSRSEAERGQLLDIARKLATEMKCQVQAENQPDEYIVWLYGSRRQIGALMRELAPRG